MDQLFDLAIEGRLVLARDPLEALLADVESLYQEASIPVVYTTEEYAGIVNNAFHDHHRKTLTDQIRCDLSEVCNDQGNWIGERVYVTCDGACGSNDQGSPCDKCSPFGTVISTQYGTEVFFDDGECLSSTDFIPLGYAVPGLTPREVELWTTQNHVVLAPQGTDIEEVLSSFTNGIEPFRIYASNDAVAHYKKAL